MEYPDADTLEMARTVTGTSTAAVQVALRRFWSKNGKPTANLVAMLRERVTEATRQELASFFGGAVEGGKEDE